LTLGCFICFEPVQAKGQTTVALHQLGAIKDQIDVS
jgi:hypothetical protein